MMILTRTMVLRKSPKNPINPENVFLGEPLENICARWESKLNGLNPASRNTDMPLIIHTNRGCQYVSEA